MNVNTIRNVYVHNVVINNVTVNNPRIINRVSYNGGHGGVEARPHPLAEVACTARAAHSAHGLAGAGGCMRLRRTAPQVLSTQNKGRPTIAVAARPVAARRNACGSASNHCAGGTTRQPGRGKTHKGLAPNQAARPQPGQANHNRSGKASRRPGKHNRSRRPGRHNRSRLHHSVR